MGLTRRRDKGERDKSNVETPWSLQQLLEEFVGSLLNKCNNFSMHWRDMRGAGCWSSAHEPAERERLAAVDCFAFPTAFTEKHVDCFLKDKASETVDLKTVVSDY